MRSYFFLIPLLTTSAFMLVGCTARTVVRTNTNLSQVGATNTNTTTVVNENVNTVVNADVAINANTVANENVNTSVVVNTSTSAHSDWKTYTNTTYAQREGHFNRFALQYPRDLLVSEDLGGPVFYTPSISVGGIPKGPKEFIMVVSDVYGDPTTVEGCLNYFEKEQAVSSIFNLSHFTKNSIKGLSFDWKIGDFTEKVYCLEQNKNVLSVIASNLQTDFEGIFDEIVHSISIE